MQNKINLLVLLLVFCSIILASAGIYFAVKGSCIVLLKIASCFNQ